MASRTSIDTIFKIFGSVFKTATKKGNPAKILTVITLGATTGLIISVKEEIEEGLRDLGDVPEIIIEKTKYMLDMLLGYDRDGDGKIDFTEYGIVQYGMIIYLVSLVYGKFKR